MIVPAITTFDNFRNGFEILIKHMPLVSEYNLVFFRSGFEISKALRIGDNLE